LTWLSQAKPQIWHPEQRAEDTSLRDSYSDFMLSERAGLYLTANRLPSRYNPSNPKYGVCLIMTRIPVCHIRSKASQISRKRALQYFIMSYAVAQATVVITEPELVLRSNPLGFHDPDYLNT